MPAFFLLLYRFFKGLWNGLKDREFRALFLWLLIILVIGTWFYARFEHMPVIDALYFCVITLATVGYGDYVPTTPGGKIFTIFYILIGIGMLSGFIILLAERSGLMRKKSQPDKVGAERSATK